jgi:mannose-6-phosphate isomerase
MSTETTTLGPIPLAPIFQTRIWGVDTLPAWYNHPAANAPIGEVWLTAETCLTPDGKTLADLTKQYPQALAAAADLTFPLLMKVLLPREKLSVQVHPNDQEAALLGQPRGKTECWYILSADPGATVAVGLNAPLTAPQLRAAIESNTLEHYLNYIPVAPGDLVFVDAGTIHAIGPGMVVLETQQYSDVTYRLYDYGRPRELHIDAGLAVSKSNTRAGLIKPTSMISFVRLVASDYFLVDRFLVTDDLPAELGLTTQLQILVALTEGCVVTADATPAINLPPGTAVLLPAEGIPYTLEGNGTVIRIAQP